MEYADLRYQLFSEVAFVHPSSLKKLLFLMSNQLSVELCG